MQKKMTDREIEEHYQSAAFRLTQERSDFLLPQILDFVRAKKWLNLRPEYQRRLVWDKKKRSRFIESLLMNIPIPPVFLYEWDLNRYEVMDGQQRLTTIVEFYENRFKLSGLEKWTALNGKKYSDLPPVIQRGLDRRRISATVLLAESAKSTEDKMEVRRTVFERLNTGGQTLNAQELRNSLYSGCFNELLVELAGDPVFNDVWGIPRYTDNIRGEHVAATLANNRYYKRMIDCEIVLRFFALRVKSRIKGSIRDILDKCMNDNKDITEVEINELRSIFKSRLYLAHKVFDPDTFCIYDKGEKKLSQPLYDAVMVAIDRLFDNSEQLKKHSKKIQIAFKHKLKDNDFHALIVGRPNTADAIRKRIDEVEKFLKDCIQGA